MFAYWGVFFFLVILCVIFPTYDSRLVNSKWYVGSVIATVLLLALFAGLRKASNDYTGYEAIFSRIPALDSFFNKISQAQRTGAELGFVLVGSILKLFSEHVAILMMFSAFWAVYLNIYSFERMSPYLFLSILLYFVHNFLLKETVQVRQGLASAVIMFGLIKYNRRLRFLTLVGVATLIQSTAIAIIIPYAFYNLSKKLKNKTYLIILVSIFIVSLVFSGRKVLVLVLKTVGLPGALGGYIGYDTYDYDLGYLNPMFIKQLLFFFLFLSFKPQLEKRFKYFDVLFNFYFCGILWYIYFKDFAILAGRVSNMFVMGEVVLVPMLISLVAPKEKVVFYLILIVYALLNFVLNLRSDSIFPYQNILF